MFNWLLISLGVAVLQCPCFLMGRLFRMLGVLSSASLEKTYHSVELFALLQTWWDLEDQVHANVLFWLSEPFCSNCQSVHLAILQSACITFLEYPLHSTAGYLIHFHALARSRKIFGMLWHHQIWSGAILLHPFYMMIVSCEDSRKFFPRVSLLSDIQCHEVAEYSVWLVILALLLYACYPC